MIETQKAMRKTLLNNNLMRERKAITSVRGMTTRILKERIANPNLHRVNAKRTEYCFSLNEWQIRSYHPEEDLICLQSDEQAEISSKFRL
jgi:hypothetical protein